LLEFIRVLSWGLKIHLTRIQAKPLKGEVMHQGGAVAKFITVLQFFEGGDSSVGGARRIIVCWSIVTHSIVVAWIACVQVGVVTIRHFLRIPGRKGYMCNSQCREEERKVACVTYYNYDNLSLSACAV
jgi:hypothetical protein